MNRKNVGIAFGALCGLAALTATAAEIFYDISINTKSPIHMSKLNNLVQKATNTAGKSITLSQNVILQSEAVLCAPRLSLQYKSALCISNHIFGRMSIKPLPHFARKNRHPCECLFFCFFLHFFVFAGSGIVVLLQATHNTLPARSKALHIGRRQPKALCAYRFPPALRDQTRRWYRKRRSWTADAKCKWPFCFAQRN
jgi:hypothetical protein